MMAWGGLAWWLRPLLALGEWPFELSGAARLELGPIWPWCSLGVPGLNSSGWYGP